MAGPSHRNNPGSPATQLAISAKVFQDLESVIPCIEDMYPPRVLNHLTKLADDMGAPLMYFTNSLPALFANSLGTSIVRKSSVGNMCP